MSIRELGVLDDLCRTADRGFVYRFLALKFALDRSRMLIILSEKKMMRDYQS